jgi:hypothetical protein
LRKSIIYFEKSGPINTEKTIKLAYERSLELDIMNIVVATIHGATPLKTNKIFNDPKFNIVAVSISEAYEEEGWTMTDEERTKLENRGIKVFTGTHALGGDVNAAFTDKFGGKSFNNIVAQTLYAFGQGMKVCIEIALMAADAGLIPADKEVIAIAGTDTGADTAIVVKPSYPRKFLELRVKEIIAKPRDG